MPSEIHNFNFMAMTQFIIDRLQIVTIAIYDNLNWCQTFRKVSNWEIIENNFGE